MHHPAANLPIFGFRRERERERFCQHSTPKTQSGQRTKKSDQTNPTSRARGRADGARQQRADAHDVPVGGAAAPIRRRGETGRRRQSREREHGRQQAAATGQSSAPRRGRHAL